MIHHPLFLKSVQIYLICAFAALIFASPAHTIHKVELKPGAKGTQCLKCHEELQKTVKKRSVHPLLKKGECTGCHDPHTSNHKKLLVAEPKKLCSNCHQKILPAKSRSTHQVVVEGNCQTCHNSHGSDNRFILSKSGNALCVECHKDIGAMAQNVQFKHDPLQNEKGCLNCHNPHASLRADNLLKNEMPVLCTECHKTDRPFFARRHMDYKVDNSNCNSCHNTHGSNKKGILYDQVHAPVADKQCIRCHPSPTAANALQSKKQGVLLCQECHKDMIAETFGKNRVHWPLADKVACLNCHNPHGTREKKLLNDTQVKVCGKCHSDTVELQKWSKENPKNKNLCEPVKKGECASCHSPHAADNILLITQKNISIDLCGKCHEWQSHSTHPIGEKAIDQRNKNLTVECLSCHLGCGTGNKPRMMPFESTYDLCIQCHVDRRR